MSKAFEILIDTNEPVRSIIGHLVLAASTIFHEKTPDAWAESMTELQAAIGEHVASNDETGTS